MVAITSFWMWASMRVWLDDPFSEVAKNYNNLSIFTLLFTLLLVLLSLGWIFFRNRLWSIYLGIIISLTFLGIFGISNINLVGVFILIMLFYHAQDIVVGEINERIKMNSRLLIKKGLANSVVAFFILISFAVYQSPAIKSFKDVSELPSSSQIFIKKVVGGTLGGQIDQVSPSEKEAILNQVTQEVIRESNLFLKPYFEYIPPALAFGLFLILWGVSWIFIWLAVFIGMLFFQILQKTKFFKIEERDVRAETIVV